MEEQLEDAKKVVDATLEFALLIDKIGGYVLAYGEYMHMCIVLDEYLKKWEKK